MRKLFFTIVITIFSLLNMIPALAQDGMMHLRVAHFSADAPAVDIYINGDVAIDGLEFPMVTDWLEIAEGNYDIAVAPAGTSLDDAVIGPASFNLVAGTWITVAAVGSVDAGTLAPNVLIEDYSDVPEEGFGRISVTHAIEGAPGIDVVTNGITIINRLAYPGTLGSNDGFFIRNIPIGSSDIQVVLSSDQFTPVVGQPNVEIEENVNYLIAAVGTVDDPQLVFVATPIGGDMSMMMADEDMMDEEMSEDSTDEGMDEEMSEESVDEDMGDEMMTNTIADIVIAAEAENAEFTVLLAAISAADPTILEALSDPDASLTVFAPTDEAFVSLLEALEMDAQTLLADTDLLNSVLQYHVLSDTVMAETVLTLDGESVPTLLGEDATISISVTDEGVVLNDSINVITTDIEADNGVIHVIDGVLVPGSDNDESMEDDMSEDSMDEEMMSNTIADIVVAATETEGAEFTVLLAAISAADPTILEALSDPDASLTVFAPTDAAFVALLEALEMDAETLLADTDLLNTVLQYHVLDGAVMAETVLTLNGESVPTLLGEDATISISITDDGVVLNDTINVIITDIEADNGVIHVIDGVLVPAE